MLINYLIILAEFFNDFSYFYLLVQSGFDVLILVTIHELIWSTLKRNLRSFGYWTFCMESCYLSTIPNVKSFSNHHEVFRIHNCLAGVFEWFHSGKKKIAHLIAFTVYCTLPCFTIISSSFPFPFSGQYQACR